jgi:hypothetical protein
MKNIIAVVLIALALALGYFGYSTLQDSGGSLEIGELEISAQDSSQKNQGYILLGLGVVCLIGGVYTLKKRS